jgi:hypothetical protein
MSCWERFVSRDGGLRTGRRISHVFIMDVPTYHKVLIVTDAAINIAPTLEDKVDICQNAIDLAISLGLEKPKLAILCAVEVVNSRCRQRSMRPRFARWPNAGKSRARSWMDRSRSTTQSAKKRKDQGNQIRGGR